MYNTSFTMSYTEKLSIYPPIHPFIYLSMALQPFVGPWQSFSVSLSFSQSVGLFGRGISPSQGQYLHKGQQRNRINAHIHPSLKWDSNPRFQCSNGPRHFMPWTTRPLWSALTTICLCVNHRFNCIWQKIQFTWRTQYKNPLFQWSPLLQHGLLYVPANEAHLT
jgi:hypothetical protein